MSSTSPLVTYFGTDCQKSNTRTLNISKITIHHLAMIGNCDTIQSVIQKYDTSWNYGIGNDGNIGVYVVEERRAWSGDTIVNDSQAVTIVVANSSVNSEYPISDDAYSSLIELCIDVCERNNIPKLEYSASSPNTSTLTLHSQFNKDVTCPGTYIRSKLNSICKSVNRAISAHESNTKRSLPQISTYDALMDNVVVLDPRNKVLNQKFTPYAVTVSKNVKTIDINKLRNSKISAVFVYAGQLYDSLHNNRHTYQAENLDSQMESIIKNDFPRGLIGIVRARNVSEAQEECKWLHLVVEKYPADLGVWLSCNFTDNKTTNGLILDTYLSEFERWGVSNKCGLYIDRNNLEKIDWKTYQVYFYLWLVDHSQSIPDINTIIAPKFFDV